LLRAHRDQAQVHRSEQAEQNGTPRSIAGPSSELKADSEKSPLVLLPPEESVDQLTERSQLYYRLAILVYKCMAECTQTGVLAMRTIPLILKNGDQKIKVNALLDQAFTKTYI